MGTRQPRPIIAQGNLPDRAVGLPRMATDLGSQIPIFDRLVKATGEKRLPIGGKDNAK